MNRTLRITLTTLGVFTVLTFVFTGHYMDGYYNHLDGYSNFDRMSFRAGHIYILLSGLLLGLMGMYFELAKNPIFRIAQLAGSLFILIAIGLFIYSFFTELPTETIERPSARRGIYYMLYGGILHLLSRIDNLNLKSKNGKEA